MEYFLLAQQWYKWYNYTMKPVPQSTKLWMQTIRKLKLIAALTGSSMVAVADRLADAELKRIQEESKSDDPQSKGVANA